MLAMMEIKKSDHRYVCAYYVSGRIKYSHVSVSQQRYEVTFIAQQVQGPTQLLSVPPAAVESRDDSVGCFPFSY